MTSTNIRLKALQVRILLRIEITVLALATANLVAAAYYASRSFLACFDSIYSYAVYASESVFYKAEFIAIGACEAPVTALPVAGFAVINK